MYKEGESYLIFARINADEEKVLPIEFNVTGLPSLFMEEYFCAI